MNKKELAIAVWQSIDSGLSVKEIIDQFPDEDEYAIRRHTTEINGFRTDKTDKELAKSVGWTESKIVLHRKWWIEYENRDLEGDYYEEVLDAARQFRSRMVNPEIGLEGFNQPSIWFWKGFDWRLFPDFWFDAVCPFIEFASNWIKKFDNLMENLAESDFQQLHDTLRRSTIGLQHKIDSYAHSIGEEDPEFKERWDNLYDALGIELVDYFNPKKFPEDDTIEYLKGLSLDEDVYQRFEEKIPDLKSKHDSMKMQLQDLWDFLEPSNIKRIIKNRKFKRSQ